jgi:hypothetical protein
VNSVVDLANVVDSALRVGGCPKRRKGQEGAGALQASPGITAVTRVRIHGSHRQWMQ